ncbi:TonB-dependent siderophore receptor [Halarcobacter bivalviorum]|uniref:TonB-dependent ferric coprogen/ferric-rhodotorulic acid receptor n=1 Tax=Halarcobacter bivalviorum TaxID=663364 RepID=A0AAX2A861_9BACT|nr:TonB-dependent siderophore receptor [Halarcobacter bivalviorum]AXH13123.1 TonB-dependent ferric coprogen/ferric-rhodotorulic acid receptor [Halarcobacter bivalviorum]RXK10263.1 TonB-dependent siderophore receptor [Halarcobacter bivalviorum]
MKLSKQKILGLSFCTAFLIHGSVFAAENNKEKTSLGTVEVVSSNDSETTNSYTVDSMNSATKLNLSLRHTPQSVNVLTTQKLNDLGITSYQEMLTNVTGVSLDRWDERLKTTARGFEIDYYKVDGMPTYITYNDRDLDLAMFDRVEIVRGANGLTTGAGNPALSINLVRKRATSKEFKADASISVGSWDAYSFMTDISSALNSDGSIRGRLIAKHQDKNSFMDGYEKENNLLYGVVDMDLTDSTFVSVGASYQNIERKGVRWGGLPAFYSDGSKTNFDRSLTVSDDWTYWDTEVKSIFANLEQLLYKDISLNLAYSYDEIDNKNAMLYFKGKVNKADGSGISYMDWESDKTNKQHNLDLNLKLPFEFGNLAQEIIIGTSYNKDKTSNYKGRYPNGYYSSLPNFFNYDLTLAKVSNADIPYIVEPEEIEQKAIYLAGNFSLTETLKLIAGARVSSWEYSSTDETKEKRKFDNELTPYVGVVYDLDKNHSIYASYTSIFKPSDKKNRSDNFLDPIEGKNYETGIKAEYFDGKLNASLSVFRIEQDGAEEDGTPIAGKQPYKLVSGVVSKGFELDLNGQITDNLNLSFGVANYKAETAEGEKFDTKASRTTANLFAKYSMNKFQVGAGVNYKSKFYTGAGAEKITQKAYAIANAMASYKLNSNTNLQLNVNNVFDKKYYSGIGANSMTYGDPRNVMLTLKYTF